MPKSVLILLITDSFAGFALENVSRRKREAPPGILSKTKEIKCADAEYEWTEDDLRECSQTHCQPLPELQGTVPIGLYDTG